MKTVTFQQDDVIICDASRHFGVFFGVWNRLVMNYPRAKFHLDTAINNGDTCTCIEPGGNEAPRLTLKGLGRGILTPSGFFQITPKRVEIF